MTLPLYSPKIVTGLGEEGGEVTKTFSEVNRIRSMMRSSASSAFSAIGVAVVFLVVAVQVGAMD